MGREAGKEEKREEGREEGMREEGANKMEATVFII